MLQLLMLLHLKFSMKLQFEVINDAAIAIVNIAAVAVVIGDAVAVINVAAVAVVKCGCSCGY